MRNRRYVQCKGTKSSNTVVLENFDVSAALNNNATPLVSVTEQIRDKQQPFFTSYQEFGHLFVDNNELINEFECYNKFSDFEGKVERLFKKSSKFFKIATTSELDLFDYIQIYREIERKVCRSNGSILEVIKLWSMYPRSRKFINFPNYFKRRVKIVKVCPQIHINTPCCISIMTRRASRIAFQLYTRILSFKNLEKKSL